MTLSGGPLGAFAVDNREDWFDPMVGLKGLSMLGSSKFYLSGFILIGGFGAGSDFMWDGNLNIGYQWTETFSTTFGYSYSNMNKERFLDVIGIEDSSTVWELFYNLELTPAVHLMIDAQVVNSALPNIDTATILGTSLQMRF